MNKQLFLVLLIWLVGGLFIYSQEPGNIGIETGDLAECEIIRNETFNGTSLWGLIDGGADVYLEYGFLSLLLQEVKKEDTNFRIEIYKMMDPESAFGIYSMSCFKCQKKNNLFRLNCLNPYQFQTVIGDSYISIINDTGSEKDQEFSELIAKKIVGKIENDLPDFPGIFKHNVFKPYLGNLKYFKGKLGLQNGYSLLSERFENYSGYNIYLLPVEDDVLVSYIQFDSEKKTNIFLKDMFPESEDEKFGKTESGKGDIKVYSKSGKNSVILLEYNNNNKYSETFISRVNQILSDQE